MKHILLVDDDESNITLLLGVLGNEYELSVALSGEEALESIEEEIPDLIVLDIIMGGITGIDVCKKLKQDDATSSIPIILLSATNNALKESIQDIGADALMGKPFRVEVLQEKIRSILS